MAESQKKEEISPEEKLLNVIQGEQKEEAGDSKPKTAESRPQNGKSKKEKAIEGKPEGQAPAGPKQKKLKVKKSAGRAKKKEADSGDEAGDSKPQATDSRPETGQGKKKEAAEGKSEGQAPASQKPGLIGGSSAPASKPKKEGKAIAFNVSAINKIMGVAVILVLALIGYEVWANVGGAGGGGLQTTDDGLRSTEGGDLSQRGGMGETGDLPGLQDLLNSFAEKPMLRVFEATQQPKKGEETVVETKVIRKGKFEQYASQNLNLVALSTTGGGKKEGVVLDKKGGKTLFLSEGQEALVGEWKVEVVGIQSDRLLLKVDDKQVVVK